MGRIYDDMGQDVTDRFVARGTYEELLEKYREICRENIKKKGAKKTVGES